MMSGIDLHMVQEAVLSVEARLPAVDEEDPAGREPARDRLVEVMLALSGRIDIDEGDGISAAHVADYHADATLERLAMVGFCFGF